MYLKTTYEIVEKRHVAAILNEFSREAAEVLHKDIRTDGFIKAHPQVCLSFYCDEIGNIPHYKVRVALRGISHSECKRVSEKAWLSITTADFLSMSLPDMRHTFSGIAKMAHPNYEPLKSAPKRRYHAIHHGMKRVRRRKTD